MSPYDIKVWIVDPSQILITQYKKTNKTNKTRVKSKKPESPSEKTEAVSKKPGALAARYFAGPD